jgi:hypothetical protein
MLLPMTKAKRRFGSCPKHGASKQSDHPSSEHETRNRTCKPAEKAHKSPIQKPGTPVEEEREGLTPKEKD